MHQHESLTIDLPMLVRRGQFIRKNAVRGIDVSEDMWKGESTNERRIERSVAG